LMISVQHSLRSRRHRLLGSAALVPLFIVTSCGGMGNPILVDVHPTAAPEMRAWQTYAWMEMPPLRVAGMYSEFMQDHIRAVADEALFARGLLLTDEDPEFLLAYHAGTGGLHAEEIMGMYDYSWADWYAPTTPDGEERWPWGTFILDIVRASDNTLVWRGVAPRSIGPNPSRQGLLGQLSNTIPRILERFPPDELRP
jgi:hypothetical protein